MNAPRHISAVIGFFLGMFVVTSAFAEGNVTITDAARQHFKAGVAYIDDPSGPKFEEAYREFRLAHADSPSYKILSNLGLCALNLERDGEAIEFYEGFLAEAKPEDIPADKRALMVRDIETLKASLVKLTLTGGPVTLTLDDERIPSKGSPVINRYTLKDGTLSIGLHPGHHRITASAEGYVSESWDLEAESAGTFSHEFQLKPVGAAVPTVETKPATTPPKRSPKTSPFVYVGLAATGVFTGSAIATGLLTKSKMDRYETVNAAGNDPEEARSLKDRGTTYALISDISIGAAILSAGATAVVYFVGTSPKTEAKAQSARWHVVPSVTNREATIGVYGQF